MARAVVVEEVVEFANRCSRVYETAPQCTYFAMKVCPFPSLAGKEADTADDGPKEPFCNAFFIAIVSAVYCKHHCYRTHDKDEGHQAHEKQRKVGMAHEGERLENLVRVRPN